MMKLNLAHDARPRGRRLFPWFLWALVVMLVGTTPAHSQTTEALLDSLQRTAFQYFWDQANPANGLIKDRSTLTSPCSIAAVGFGLSAICIGVDHGWVSRASARDRVLTTLNTFWTQPQGTASSGTIGYKGLFYHFLDMGTALRTWNSELSTIDTALLLAGILDAKQYFTADDPSENQIRALADSIYYRADWKFMQNSNPGIMMGWKPGTGFSGFGQWIGYNEAMVLYILALGSPTHPATSGAWSTWTSGYSSQTYYGYSYVICITGSLFINQYSHCWIDFRHIRDSYMMSHSSNYFENSRRATLAQRAYCVANPGHYTGYSDSLWGLTACDDPMSGYASHGAPPIPTIPPSNAAYDNGTLAPTAPAGSIVFTPEESIAALRNMWNSYHGTLWGPYGFRDAFNLSLNWWDADYLGIDEGPIALMIQNFYDQGVWNRFMQNADIQHGLQGAGFVSFPAAVESFPGRPSISLSTEPNPFVHSTRVGFRLPWAGPVKLTVYDVMGREIRTLLDDVLPAGQHSVTFSGEGLPVGVYSLRLFEPSGAVVTGRCVRMR